MMKRIKLFLTIFLTLALGFSACGTGASSTSGITGANSTTSASAPSAPTGVSAISGNAQATVSWNGVTGATSYNVYYKTSSGATIANGTKVTGATPGGAITPLSNNTTYYFVVTAVNSSGESAISSEISATPKITAPAGVSATAGNKLVTLSWTPVSGATSYNVYYKTTSGVTTANGTKVTAVTSGGAIAPLTNGTTYYFVVTSISAGVESAVSSEVTATPILLMGGSVQGKTLSLAGAVTTFLLGSKSVFSGGMVSDGKNLYFLLNTDIHKVVIATGAESTLASITDINSLSIATDGQNLYVSNQSEGTIQKIVIATGVVTTFAGTKGTGGYADGIGASIRFDHPRGITSDGTNLYVVDQSGTAIRKISIATANATTMSLVNPTTGVPVSLQGLFHITTDGTSVFLTTQLSSSITKVDIISGGVSYATGAGTVKSIATDGFNLYMAIGNQVFKMDINSTVSSVIAGAPTGWGFTDGIGTAAEFNGPMELTTDGTSLFVRDGGNDAIRKIQ